MTERPSLFPTAIDAERAPFLARVESHWRAVLFERGERDIHHAIRAMADGTGLAPELAVRVFEQITAGSEDELDIAAFLLGTDPQVLAPATIAACARVMLARSHRIRPDVPGALADTCGTGGDGLKTLNVSTAAALVLVSSDVPVAKHGNRAITSSCGSADVLESMGVAIDLEPEAVTHVIERARIGFLFAPRFHPSMRFVQSVRRHIASDGHALGRSLKTVFNVLGPLTNPAGARIQLVGVYARELVAPVAHSLAALGLTRGLVVHGLGPSSEPMDEISPFGPTFAATIDVGGVVTLLELEPGELGVRAIDAASVAPAPTVAENAARIRAILSGADDPARELIALNAGAALWIAGRAPDIRSGLAHARNELGSGSPRTCLDRLVEATHR